eukprot:CAMPEP_0117516124 /NCGR_PEP_ID=MMETSP0784-20121206/30932_1 /TAXON_ID=39447 /ORGANISM="" /LENGTH=994 /DNA_ID=CAMNT_0005311959 /DNA_START=29 /DNA_END=3013 /DNA_ORIENTATION=-
MKSWEKRHSLQLVLPLLPMAFDELEQRGNSGLMEDATHPLAAEGDGHAECREAAPLDEVVAIRAEAEYFASLAAELREIHPEEPNLRRSPVGMALSGGGTRAAAFHCGVFWSLASAGLLKDVQHLCAVSGGGYTATSYITHLCRAASEGGPGEQEPLDEWYQRVVARFILRMQRNINYIVDITPGRLFRLPDESRLDEAGSSCGPRIFDLPLFLCALFGSMTLSPMLLMLHTLWPIVVSIELFHGAVLRSAWCDPTTMAAKSSLLVRWFLSGLSTVAFVAIGAILLALASKVGLFPRTPERFRCYLYGRSLSHVLERGAICYVLYILVVVAIVAIQTAEWGDAADDNAAGAWVRALCHGYVAEAVLTPTCADCTAPDMPTWYSQGGPALYLNETWAAAHASWPPASPRHATGMPRSSGGPTTSVIGYAVASLGFSGIALAGVGVLIWRYMLLRWLFTIVGPLLYFCAVAQVTRWRVFGPVTHQLLIPSGMGSLLGYRPELARTLLECCAAGALSTLPVYDVVQKFAHLFYRRSLKRAFFDSGRDLTIETVARNPYCPNLLFGACLHDFRKPWEDTNHCDFTLSSLFVGSGRTGFFLTPARASLARLMTIAGAATDATFLLNADVLAIRFVLAVVSLRFGDFLRVEPVGLISQRLEGRIIRSLRSRQDLARLVLQQSENCRWISQWLQGLLDRFPAACPFIIGHLLLLFAVLVGTDAAPGTSGCMAYNVLLRVSMATFLVTLALSFFAHVRPLQWLMRSPMIQQCLLLCMHRYKAERAPPYLYISDGGLIEVLGILPLLRRRLERIVVSDAAEDPALSMRCLRDAIVTCRKERLCSFYDPRDPRRDLEFVLQDLRDGGAAFLRLGIRYEASGDVDGGEQLGELFYVRMRLLPGDQAPVRPLLSLEELLQSPRPAAALATPLPRRGRRERLRRDFTGACCRASECGGLCVGRRFPNFGVSNQFLTPLHFANLCGLGAELSEPLIMAMRCDTSSVCA